MRQPNMLRAKGFGIEIQVADWPGEGRPVLAVHGLTANSRCWDVMASALSPKHRFLAVDLRGRGLSDKPKTGYSIDYHCRDLEAVLKDLGLAKAAVLGHSLGAYIALALAATRPEIVDRLILMDGGAQLPVEQWLKIAAGIKPSLDRLEMTFPSFDDYLASVKGSPFFQPWTKDMEDFFRYESEEVGGVFRSRTRPENILEERTSLAQTDTARYYKDVRCPVLILRATQGMVTGDDHVLPQAAANELLKTLPGARLVNVQGTNHYSILLQPNEQRNRAILDFLA
ncbi:MAG: alpha/beta hydrolase [Pseudomonadota bacterium]